MTLSSISSGSGPSAAQLYRLATTASPADASSSSSTTQKSTGTSRFAAAIADAFASLGLSLDATDGTATSASTTGTDASNDPSDSAVGAFIQSLLAALHGQSAGDAPPPPPPDDADPSGSASTSSVAATDATVRSSGAGRMQHARGHGDGGKIASDLQGLIRELSSSTDTDTAASSASTTASPDATLVTLEQRFDALVAQGDGATAAPGTDALRSFLEALASSLHGAPATGNVVTTQA